MFAHIRKYGIIFGLLLFGSCADEDATGVEPGTSETPGVPISFVSYAEEYQTEGADTRAANGLTGPITPENYQLRHAGFGVFAATETGISPNLMYNQEVKFTVLADGSDNGFWSYYPIKYWPNDQTIIDNLYFCAYAPYVETPADDFKDDPSNTGIVGISANDDNDTPYIIYARAKNPDETVDLLWSYLSPTSKPAVESAVQMPMHHALARVAVNLKLSSAPAANTKVLVRRVTLTPTTLAKSGKLDLTSHSTYTVDENEVVVPSWDEENFTWEATAEDRTIIIDHNPSTTPASYGVVDNAVRLIPGLPYSWQPAGLNASDYQNVLSYEGHQGYLYFIPQSSFTVACTVAYTIYASDGSTTLRSKTTSSAATLGNPLRGNITYHLNLTLDVNS